MVGLFPLMPAVLHQLEDGKSWATNELVAQQLQKPGTRSER